jgi:hypothetical protein
MLTFLPQSDRVVLLLLLLILFHGGRNSLSQFLFGPLPIDLPVRYKLTLHYSVYESLISAITFTDSAMNVRPSLLAVIIMEVLGDVIITPIKSWNLYSPQQSCYMREDINLTQYSY